MFWYSHVKTAPTASNTPLMTGSTYVWNQPTTALTAAMIPSHAGLMPLFHSHITPAAIPFHTACRLGHTTATNQATTTFTGVLIAAHVASTAARTPPLSFTPHTNPATTATVSVRMTPIGVARIAEFNARGAIVIAFMAAIRIPVSVSHCDSITIVATAMPLWMRRPAFHATNPAATAAIYGESVFSTPPTVAITSGSFPIPVTIALPIGARAGVIFSIIGSITSPTAFATLSFRIAHWFWNDPVAASPALIICLNVLPVPFCITSITSSMLILP